MNHDMTLEQRILRLEKAIAELASDTYGPVFGGSEPALRAGKGNLASIMQEIEAGPAEDPEDDDERD